LSLLVPMGLLAFLRPVGRVACFVLGLLVGLGGEMLLGAGGIGHNPMAIVPFLGFAVALAAVLVEGPAFFIRRMRRRRAGATPDD
jgi:hypothetical protein